MRVLAVSDLHYDLRKLDWVLAHADGHDLVAIVGDLLDISSAVTLDAQIVVVLEYLARIADRAPLAVCSGNHDLDHREESGEKATAWLTEAGRDGVVVDGGSATIDGWLVTACAWWEGPVTLARLERSLDDAARVRDGKWLWLYHGPPEGPLAWTGSTFYGDPELPRLLDTHEPDVVLCGHIHQAPHVPDGAWVERRGRTWLFNAGMEIGPEPAHVLLDLDGDEARWWSYGGSGERLMVDGTSPAP